MNNLIKKDKAWDIIGGRSFNLDFNIFNEEGISKIADRMVEVDRASRSFGRKNTQTTNRLMTLTMLNSSSPYRILRQCLAEIERKRGAIQENRFIILEKLAQLENLGSCNR